MIDPVIVIPSYKSHTFLIQHTYSLYDAYVDARIDSCQSKVLGSTGRNDCVMMDGTVPEKDMATGLNLYKSSSGWKRDMDWQSRPRICPATHTCIHHQIIHGINC